MVKTLLPKLSVREFNRKIDRASSALIEVSNMADDFLEQLDTEDANAIQLRACDDLESLRDEAEDVEATASRLFDLTQKLQRYTRITRRKR